MELEITKTNKQGLARQTPKSSSELWTAISDVDISGNNTSVLAVRGMGGNPISSLVKKNDGITDKSECHKFIKLCTVYLCQFFGVTWNDVQIMESSKQLYENYYFWTEYDWKHFMSRVVSGYFGKMFGAFNPSMLMEYAAAHGEEWMNVSEGLSVHEMDLIKRSEDKVADFTKMIDSQRENRIHQSALEDFKSKMSNRCGKNKQND